MPMPPDATRFSLAAATCYAERRSLMLLPFDFIAIIDVAIFSRR